MTKTKIGFAAMTPERRKKIAAKGGRKAQRLGKVKLFNSRTGRLAGRKSHKNSKK